jgi:hypothetical protein
MWASNACLTTSASEWQMHLICIKNILLAGSQTFQSEKYAILLTIRKLGTGKKKERKES